MFGFGKKKKQQAQEENAKPAKKGKMDKLIMGAIVGVAVGSVIGMAVAPKKGSETREIITQKGREAIDQGKKYIEESKEKTKKKGIFRRVLRAIVFGREKAKKTENAGPAREDVLKKIPSEVE